MLMEDDHSQPSWSPEDNQQPQYEQDNLPDFPTITWSASEYVSHQKNISWYIALGAGAAVMTLIIFLVTRSLMSSLVIALSFIVLGIFAARQPDTKQYEIGENGIRVGDKSFPYSIFKSFSVMQEDAIDSIWLRPLKRFMPTTVIYCAPDDEEKIVMMLENFLPEEDREQDVIDRISRRIRF